jgi:hypothetical protein
VELLMSLDKCAVLLLIVVGKEAKDVLITLWLNYDQLQVCAM